MITFLSELFTAAWCIIQRWLVDGWVACKTFLVGTPKPRPDYALIRSLEAKLLTGSVEDSVRDGERRAISAYAKAEYAPGAPVAPRVRRDAVRLRSGQLSTGWLSGAVYYPVFTPTCSDCEWTEIRTMGGLVRQDRTYTCPRHSHRVRADPARSPEWR